MSLVARACPDFLLAMMLQVKLPAKPEALLPVPKIEVIQRCREFVPVCPESALVWVQPGPGFSHSEGKPRTSPRSHCASAAHGLSPQVTSPGA